MCKPYKRNGLPAAYFRENERIRLITVFFHDKPTEEESLLFVGHVGVLLTAKDGTLYFVEKGRLPGAVPGCCALWTERR